VPSRLDQSGAARDNGKLNFGMSISCLTVGPSSGQSLQRMRAILAGRFPICIDRCCETFCEGRAWCTATRAVS